MLRKLLPRLFGGYRANAPSTPLLLSERRLARQLTCERQRADRRKIPFCLIDISLSCENHSRSDIVRLARLLNRRLRITDAVGHRGPVTIGVILTDTPEMGGRSVLADLRHLTEHQGLKCEFELRVYDPESWQNKKLLDLPNDHDPSSGHLHSPQPAASTRQAFTKRLVDVAVSSIGLVLAALPIAIACVAIRLTSAGPAIFRQVREGAGGKPFTIYKLRTMYADAEHQQAELRVRSERDGPAFKMKNDPRVTPLGRFLRASCVDELPQLVNVLLGRMSLVGPRPLPWSESRSIQTWQRRRLDVKPGITGIWQTAKHETIAFDDWMRMDLRYIDQRSSWLDIKLLAKTVVVPMKARGNY